MTAKTRTTKATQQLVHGNNVWGAINRRLRRQRRVDAAIAYVTTVPPFVGEGSRLACDLSDRAVRQGSSDPSAVLKLIERGVEIYSHAGLHAKVIASSNVAIVGSANASTRSGLNTTGAAALIEAVTISVEPRVVKEAMGFIDSLCTESARIDPQAVRKLVPNFRKDAPKGPPPRRGSAQSGTQKTRVWRLRYEGPSRYPTADEEAAIEGSDRQAEVYVQRNLTDRYFNWPLGELPEVTRKEAQSIRLGDKLCVVAKGGKYEVSPLMIMVAKARVPNSDRFMLRTIQPPGRSERKFTVSQLKSTGALALIKSLRTRRLTVNELKRVDRLLA